MTHKVLPWKEAKNTWGCPPIANEPPLTQEPGASDEKEHEPGLITQQHNDKDVVDSTQRFSEYEPVSGPDEKPNDLEPEQIPVEDGARLPVLEAQGPPVEEKGNEVIAVQNQEEQYSRQDTSHDISNAVGFRELDEIMTQANLVYQTDNTQVYAVPKDIDINQYPELTSGDSQFIKNRKWNVTEELEKMKQDALMEDIMTRLQATEIKLQRIEELVYHIQALEERLQQEVKDNHLQALDVRLRRLEEFFNSSAFTDTIRAIVLQNVSGLWGWGKG